MKAHKQFGNSTCINVIDAVAEKMLDYLNQYKFYK